MKNLNKNNLLFQKVSALKGIGKKLEKYLKNKKIEKVKFFGLFDDTSNFAPYNNGKENVPISLNVIAYK